jgi:nucleoside-diphosphate kinase
MVERTLAIIKPDAVKKGITDKILQRIEEEDFKVSGMRTLHLTKEEAQGFYMVHQDKPFYESLTDFMSSGEIVIMVLEREDAIHHWRQVMGATDPALADSRTLRRAYGTSIEQNAVHGSDSPETAVWEIDYFYKEKERAGAAGEKEEKTE